jgi:hypothetical protein
MSEQKYVLGPDLHPPIADPMAKEFIDQKVYKPGRYDKYFVVDSDYPDKVLGSGVIKDYANIVAQDMSRKKGNVFLVFSPGERGKKTPVAFAYKGALFWPKQCTRCQGHGCYDCGLTGAVPDYT